MNKIEVNPKLFVTCRLCLEGLGQYQIVPEVKEQIFYCFDIHVEPFDGLPQLICKKCEAILGTYSKIKKKFIEKQNDLKRNISQSFIGSLSQLQEQNSVDNPCNKKGKVSVNKKHKRCFSTSSSDTECDRIANGKNSNTKLSESWLADYTKQYVCRICNSQWVTRKSLLCHFAKHSSLTNKYSHVFKRHSIVRLHKIDGKSNITGCKEKVMHGRGKIIINSDPRYYTMYKYKNSNIDDVLWNEKGEKIDKSKDYESSDSSQDNIVFKRKRIRRLCSRSSSETVVLDKESIKSKLPDKESRNSGKISTPADLGECINIDDSSEDETPTLKEMLEKKKIKKQRNTEDIHKNVADKPNQVTIHDVITACRSKYVRKHYQENLLSKDKPSNIALKLKRKILSLGRKVIHKKVSVNCTPLLRFMDHKNLDITWIPREITINQDANCIRVMTRIRSSHENCGNETGWTDYIPTRTRVYRRTASTPNEDVNSVDTNSSVNNVPNEIDIPEMPPLSATESTLPGNAILIYDASVLTVDTKKLLNENPVANPKQLPKKNIVKSVVVTSDGGISLENVDKDLYMPIITSTTSLAAPFLVEEGNNDPETASSNNNDDLKSDAPRIKVKPVSELMSAETLSRLQEPVQMPCIVSAGATGQPMTVQTEENAINLYTTETDSLVYQDTSSQGNLALNLIAPEPAWQNEFMLLDTVEMPNTKTNSPFLYFRRLLLLHNIILLDTDVDLSKEFSCLIKFKVLYKQDMKNRPVILCLALFCSKNIFCLKVKDRNQDNLDLTKISPNWQWEVLKIYKGEVMNKLLCNAQKIGPDVYENTTNFLCLLKSINLIKTS